MSRHSRRRRRSTGPRRRSPASASADPTAAAPPASSVDPAPGDALTLDLLVEEQYGRPPPSGSAGPFGSADSSGSTGSADPAGWADSASAAAQALVGLIVTGRLDDHLGELQAALSNRHRERARQASRQRAAELHVGDRVRLSRHIRPGYLSNATGTVTGWAGQNVVIQLDVPVGRFATGELRCPPLALERIR